MWVPTGEERAQAGGTANWVVHGVEIGLPALLRAVLYCDSKLKVPTGGDNGKAGGPHRCMLPAATLGIETE